MQANDCSKAELELFSSPPINIGTLKGEFTVYRAVGSTKEGGPLEFRIPGIPDLYLDPARTCLYLKGRIVKPDGTHTSNDEHVAPSNLLLHAMFQQCDIQLNNTLISSSLNTYPYVAYMENVLGHGDEAKRTHKTCEMYYEDEHTGMDKFKEAADPPNKGYDKRRAITKKSACFEMAGRLHSSLFHQDRLIPPSIDLNIKLIRSSSAFHLMYEKDNYKVELEEATFTIRRVQVNPSVALGHAKYLQSGQLLTYPLRRSIVSTCVIGQGMTSYHTPSLLTGLIPRRIILAMIANSSFNGDPQASPFNFQHYNLSFLSLNDGTQNYPSQPLTPDYSNGLFLKAYQNLYQGMGFLEEDRSFGISKEAFAQGFNFYCFDLTSDHCSDESHRDPAKFGNVQLEMRFSRGLPHPVNLIIYSEYDNSIKIDSSRSIITDFAQ